MSLCDQKKERAKKKENIRRRGRGTEGERGRREARIQSSVGAGDVYYGTLACIVVCVVVISIICIIIIINIVLFILFVIFIIIIFGIWFSCSYAQIHSAIGTECVVHGVVEEGPFVCFMYQGRASSPFSVILLVTT